MVPLNLVNIRESFISLDACASPGSKTLQIMELKYLDAEKNNILPTGVVWANEYDDKRSKMLVHLIQNHPTLNMVVTRCDARVIPISNGVQPDLIICDAPCSGDGTIRKSQVLKKNWGLNYCYDKHETQREILENCINICKVGGNIIYSTCSINPIENEAVVASVLEKYKGVVELVNVEPKLKELGLKYRQGLIKWKVYLGTKHQAYAYEYSKVKEIYEEYKNKGEKIRRKTDISETMFHPIYTNENFKNTTLHRDPLELKKCIRLYSHDNNSGSFFIAIFKKIEQISLSNPLIKYHTRLPLVELTKEESKELDPIENGKSIEDDLIEFCEKIKISNNDIDKAKLDKEHKIKEKQKLFNSNLHNDYDDEEEDLSSSIFNKFISINDLLNKEIKDFSTEELRLWYNESKISLKRFVDYFGVNDKLLNNLHCLKDSYRKIFLFSDKLPLLMKFLTDHNFYIMVAGLPVFVDARYRIFNDICKFRINFQGSHLLQNSITKKRIMNLNNSLYLKNKEIQIKSFLIELINKNELNIDTLDLDVISEIKSYEHGSLILVADEFTLPIRCGKNYIRIMVQDNMLAVLKKYVNKYISIN